LASVRRTIVSNGRDAIPPGKGFGSAVRIAAMTSAIVAPVNGRAPVSIS
jgi:hypothetical protein